MKKFSTVALALMLAASAFAGDKVPWSCDFAETNAIRNWPKAAANTKSRGMVQSSQQLYMQQAPTTGYNDYYLWFTENGFDLEAGKSYRFDIDSRTNTDAGNKYFEILLYKKGEKTPVITDANTQVMKISSITQTFITYSGYFEPEETGEYYLCLHAYCDYSGRALYWDNFKLVEASMDAPEKPGLTVAADPSGILKTTVEVTCPSKSIRGNAITSLTKLMVYRDGGLVKEISAPEVGSVVTLTDYVAQPGEHIYSAVAYNEYNAGAQTDYTVTVGSEVLTAKYLYKAQYTPDGQMRIVWPAKDGVTAYQVATTTGRVLEGTPVLDEEINSYTLVDAAFELGTEPNGWQYVVSEVKEDETVALLGNTNYIALNNEIPYYPAMNVQNALNGFTRDNDYEYAWQFFSGGGGCVGTTVDRDYSTKEMRVNWLISPGLKLQKDKFYRVKVTGCNDYGAVTYTIKAGRGNYREALDILVAEDVPMVKGGSSLTVVQTDEMFLSVPEDGMYFVGLTGKIPANTNSDYMRFKRFDIIEVDGSLPSAPSDVQVSYSPTGGTDGKISFRVPAKAIDGTDISGLTKVEVSKNGEPFATITEGVAADAVLTFDVEVSPGVQDVYSIRAFNAAGQGEPAMAKVLVLSTPYFNDFSSKTSLEGFTRINLKETTDNFEVYNGSVRLYPNEKGSDHWLITPPLTLKAGMYYILDFNAKAKEDDCGNLDVMLGKGADPSMLTQRVMETIPLDKAENIFMGNREEYFTVEEDGQYVLGFHFTMPEGRNISKEVYLDNLSISAGIAGTMPDRGILDVVPAADGSLKAELVYTAATKSLNGADLNAGSTQDVYFYVNGVQTPANRTFKAYPGQKISIEVEVPEDLPYIFSARTGWSGRISYKDAFVGINRPMYPDGIVLTETYPFGHLSMSWDPVTTDVEGYPLNPDLLTYDVAEVRYKTVDGQPVIEEIEMAKDVKGTTCEFDAVKPDEAQVMKRYVVRARNLKGEGSKGMLTSYVNVGKPYRMPYGESFVTENGSNGLSSAFFTEEFDGYCHWGLMSDGLEGFESADGDGGYLALEAMFNGCQGRIYTGKVNLGTTGRPGLTMMLYNHTTIEDKNLVEFKVYTYNDRKWHSLGEPRTVMDLCNGNPGWNKVTVDLSDYLDNVVICAVDVTVENAKFTSFDNFHIWEYPSSDLTFQSHNAPVSVTPGQEFSVDVKVINSGIDPAAPESVDMYVDGDKVASVDGVELKPGQPGVFSFTHSFPVVDLATSHELTFKVSFEADGDPSDNVSAPFTILTVDNSLAPVENLSATAGDDRIVSLSWDAPRQEEIGVVTETFESWEQGVANQHGWTCVDGDGRNILGINDGTGSALVIPGLPAFSPASFALVDNEEGPLPASSFPAHSGSKFLMSIIPSGTGFTLDWLISPELSGNAQTIKFYVRNHKGYPAWFDVLCSDGGMNLKSFTTGDDGSVNTGEWTEINAEIPEGTKRVAIRHTSNCEYGFMMMVDDITYEPATAASAQLKGYNVYTEAQRVGAPDTNSFTTEEPLEPGKYVYAVSARYSKGESPVVPVEVDVKESGITSSVAEGVHVFGGTGCIHVSGAQGMTVFVCDLGGVVLCNGETASDGRIAAAPGVYVVTVDGKSYKVIVK